MADIWEKILNAFKTEDAIAESAGLKNDQINAKVKAALAGGEKKDFRINRSWGGNMKATPDLEALAQLIRQGLEPQPGYQNKAYNPLTSQLLGKYQVQDMLRQAGLPTGLTR